MSKSVGISKVAGDEYILDRLGRSSLNSIANRLGLPISSVESRISTLKQAGRIPWQTLVQLRLNEGCRRREHRFYTGLSTEIAARFPGFFDVESHRLTKPNDQWQICVECGFAELIDFSQPEKRGSILDMIDQQLNRTSNPRKGTHAPSLAVATNATAEGPTMSREDQDAYISLHYGIDETIKRLCEVTGVPQGSMYFRIKSLKEAGRIPMERENYVVAPTVKPQEDPSLPEQTVATSTQIEPAEQGGELESLKVLIDTQADAYMTAIAPEAFDADVADETPAPVFVHGDTLAFQSSMTIASNLTEALAKSRDLEGQLASALAAVGQRDATIDMLRGELLYVSSKLELIDLREKRARQVEKVRLETEGLALIDEAISHAEQNMDRTRIGFGQKETLFLVNEGKGEAMQA